MYNADNWPRDESGYYSGSNFLISILYFSQCNNIEIRGGGRIDGQGWDWWNLIVTAAQGSSDDRPYSMIDVRESYGLLLEGLTLLNSPQYYVYLHDVRDVLVTDLVITTRSTSSSGVPTFPINTDGIDILGTNVTVRNVSVQNYDDVIAVKPCRSYFKYCSCSSDIHISDIRVYHGAGLSIGSVPPSQYYTCVRNVVFENIVLERPFKGVYIKTNPGSTGGGEITNISFNNIRMHNVLWWPVYIGPQQQKQPTDEGDDDQSNGCIFYPTESYCPTQPLVTISHIYLNDVVATKSITYYNAPGVVRCDVSAPCSDIHFTNVQLYQTQFSRLYMYSILEAIILQRLGSSTTDYYWRYVVENVHGSSLCNDPPLVQTFPLPGLSDLSDENAYLYTNNDIAVTAADTKFCKRLIAQRNRHLSQGKLSTLAAVGMVLVSLVALTGLVGLGMLFFERIRHKYFPDEDPDLTDERSRDAVKRANEAKVLDFSKGQRTTSRHHNDMCTQS
eukprot:CAMPEP_0182416468 /NCGR_PEP_ID=MMETSP1167-20130531/758_1 /TAXON_ID=2988 /ORGANISM="Mallomonas Sp, Strain CCMP3275" /LENGTH=501 /DNA_ID=CAMNT_0024589239 /DNA_START=408 /DNA_END=1913 /DNA_ORIENTATION=-